MRIAFTSILKNKNLSSKLPFDASLRIGYGRTNTTWVPGLNLINYEVGDQFTIILEGIDAVYFKKRYATGADRIFTYEEVSPPPASSFTVNNDNPVITEIIEFTDTSTNNPTAWLWNFGDGSTSEEQNPTHSYTDSGIYLVSLRVTNLGGQSSSSTNINVINITTSGTPLGLLFLITRVEG